MRQTVACVSCPLVPCHARRAYGTMGAWPRRDGGGMTRLALGFLDPIFVPHPHPHPHPHSHPRFHASAIQRHTKVVPSFATSVDTPTRCPRAPRRPGTPRSASLPTARRPRSASASPTPGLQGHPRDADCCIPLQHFIRFLSAANPPTATNGTSADPTKSLQGETPDALPSASSYHRKDAITDQVAEYPDPLADNRIASCVETGRLRARGHGRDEGRLPRQRPFAA